ncbi:MAG: Ku protein [Candidatus Eisenbacteria bacterium]|uniref:Non-homologous end joining protein Ku n=1 Tax=Eiseniibacteriota bacterium TaxID=2212470 RepID=A0A956NDJ6_UNCEI|nr:Ku protein [Candidatus Eisenbacteria bacterium]MCB9466290.1 Ku protein [Candidatus Eisenbacteria bacterium]
MAPRSSWKGFIKLSLVSVPVKAYTASQSGADIRLNQLHAECHSRIKYQKTCPVHGEVSNDEIVSGYEFAKGQYVVVDPDEVQKLRKQSDSSIEIQGFIPADEIDPLYYSGRTYYLVPDGPVGQKPYALFRHGMGDEEVVAFGQIILGGRTHKIILRVLEDMIVMTMLDYAEKVKKPSAFEDEVQDTSLSKEEIALTKTLIGASKISDFDFAAFKDEYVGEMTELIQAKVEGKEIVEVTEAEEPQIINLMDALKASIANAMGTGTDGPVDADGGAETKKATKTKTAKSTKTRSGSSKKSATS